MILAIISLCLSYGLLGGLCVAGLANRMGWDKDETVLCVIFYGIAFLAWPLWLPVAWYVYSIDDRKKDA